MPGGAASWGLLAAVVLFVVFLLVKTRLPLAGRDPALVEARRRLADAKRRAREAGRDPERRARAWRDAASIALDELGRPGLAATFARRAERADPRDQEAVGLLAVAMRQGSRVRALERLLYRRVAEDADGPAGRRALQELIELYDGPLQRPEQAAALRRLSGDAEPGP